MQHDCKIQANQSCRCCVFLNRRFFFDFVVDVSAKCTIRQQQQQHTHTGENNEKNLRKELNGQNRWRNAPHRCSNQWKARNKCQRKRIVAEYSLRMVMYAEPCTYIHVGISWYAKNKRKTENINTQPNKKSKQNRQQTAKRMNEKSLMKKTIWNEQERK